MSYTPKTEAEIAEIALGIFKDQIFTDYQVRKRDHHLVTTIFMGIGLMDEEQLAAFKADEPCMVYGRMEDALPRSINGYPIFTTFGCANREDAEKIIAKIKAIEAAVAPVL